MSGTSGLSIYHGQYPAVGFSTPSGPDYLIYRGGNGAPLSVWNASGSQTVFFETTFTRFTGSARAPMFYDSDNTGYYIDPNGTSALTTAIFYVNGSSEITLTSAGTNASMIKAGSGDELYIGGNNTWQMRFSGANVLMDNGGYVLNGESIRSPIFYDSNNTGRYLDPTGGSILHYANFVRATSGSDANGLTAIKIAGLSDYDSLELGVQSNYSGFIRSYGNDIHYYSGHWRTAGSTASEDHQHYWYTSKAGSANWSTWKMQLNHNADLLVTGSVRAPVFYDYDNSGYYCDPSSSSYLYGLVLSGNQYFRPNTWIQCDNSAGIYWPNHYGAHFYPNGGSTYTQLQIDGSKNSYSGMYISHSAVNGMMYDSAGNGGVYREANGRWYFYYNLSNDCMGIGTSTTSSAYGVYCNKGAYFAGRVDGTIFYDANDTTYYADLNSTGTSIRAAGNITAYYSDMRLKTHLGKIENARDKVRQLEGFYYEANELAQSFGYKAKREVGVSAQAVQAVLPEIVTDAPINSNYLTIDYERLTPLLIEAIKEQDTELVDLRNRVAQLESLINKLIGD
jgi:hypothetical protein